MSLNSVSRPAAILATLGGNLVLFLASVDIGAIAVGITGLGAAVVGLVVLGIKQVNAARVEALRAWNEVNKDTLSAQILELKEQSAKEARELKEQNAKQAAELLESQQKARDSLHALRNEANVERLRSTAEIERLTDELHAARKELQEMRVEYRRLMALMRGANVKIKDNTDRIESLEQVGSDSGMQPTVTAPTPEKPPDA